MKRVLSYDNIHNLALNIISQLDKDNFKPDVVAGFCRGGMLPAVILSQYYDCKFMPIELSFRDGLVDSHVSYNTLGKIGNTVRDEKYILIIDDICDSGKTFIALQTALESLNLDKNYIQTAALQRRHKSEYSPHYIAEHINNDDWQVYPWEITNGKNE